MDEETNNYYDEHYRKKEMQPIEVMQLVLTPEEFRGYLKGNIIKYTQRAGLKHNENVDKEMAKAKRYGEWLSRVLRGLIIDPRL